MTSQSLVPPQNTQFPSHPSAYYGSTSLSPYDIYAPYSSAYSPYTSAYSTPPVYGGEFSSLTFPPYDSATESEKSRAVAASAAAASVAPFSRSPLDIIGANHNQNANYHARIKELYPINQLGYT